MGSTSPPLPAFAGTDAPAANCSTCPATIQEGRELRSQRSGCAALESLLQALLVFRDLLSRLRELEPSPTGSTVPLPTGLSGALRPWKAKLRGGSCSVIS